MSIEGLMSAHVTPLQPVPADLEPSLDPVRPVQAVLFDIYGTLLISGAGETGAGINAEASGEQLKTLLRKYGIDISVSGLLDGYTREIKTTHARLKSKGIAYPEVNIQLIWESVLGFSDHFAVQNFAAEFEMIVNPVYPMPGLSSMLAHVTSAGTALGIISNAQFFTPHLFSLFCGGPPEQIGFTPPLIIYSHVHGQAKPSPLLFELARENINKMGIEPDSVLFVGNDMLNDVLAAKDAGFMTALFAGDQRSLRLRKDDPRCRSIRPDLVITHLEQLIEII